MLQFSYHLVYKTTNTINGKYYIGQHKTNVKEDGYLGSGKRLKKAIKKYGKENFHREILYECRSAKEMNIIEKILVVPDAETNYNLCFGGVTGGTDLINSTPELIAKRDLKINKQKGRKAANALGANLKGSAKHQHLVKTDETYRQNWISRSKKNNARPFLGKKHSEESKALIGIANSKNHSGSKNSQFGTMWINNGIECIKSRTILDGWNRGRL